MAFDINLWAVLGAAILSGGLGALWYSPVLFGKRWMAEMGYTPEIMASMKMKPRVAITLMFLGTLLTSYILAHFIKLSEMIAGTYALGDSGALWHPLVGVTAIQDGVSMGFWIWLGFLLPQAMGVVLWENKSWTLLGINASYQLVSIVLMSAILGYF